MMISTTYNALLTLLKSSVNNLSRPLKKVNLYTINVPVFVEELDEYISDENQVVSKEGTKQVFATLKELYTHPENNTADKTFFIFKESPQQKNTPEQKELLEKIAKDSTQQKIIIIQCLN